MVWVSARASAFAKEMLHGVGLVLRPFGFYPRDERKWGEGYFLRFYPREKGITGGHKSLILFLGTEQSALRLG